MEWLVGVGASFGWVTAFIVYVKLGNARSDARLYKLAYDQYAQANKRAEAVIDLKNDQLKKLREEIDALDTPDSVRARLRRLLSPPGP